MKKAEQIEEITKKLLEDDRLTTMGDVNEALEELRKKMIQKLLDKEFENHMKYEKGSHIEKTTTNRRNGIGSQKLLKTNNGEFEITTPRDREGSFEPVIVPKRKRIITELSEQITLLYAKGNSIRDIKEIIENIYGSKINEEFISEATSMVSDEVTAWKKRPLKSTYAIVYMDCLYVSVREATFSQKKALYIALGIDLKGEKEVLGFWVGDSESSSFWYGVLEEIKERGVKDILILSSDGVAGFKEILEESYPKTKHQRCIVHIIRNMSKCIARKDWKEMCLNLKTVYKAENKEEAQAASEAFKEKYKNNKLLIKKYENNEEHLLGLYEYSEYIRKLVYTTNPIEALNSSLRKVTNGKGCFVSEEALSKVLYLRIKELSKKWNRMSKANWSYVLNELIEMYGERVENNIQV